MHNLFLVYFVNLYMFRAYLGPSSGGTTVCVQQLVLIILFRWLFAWMDWNRTTDSHLKRIISARFCIHTVYLLMMGLDTPETCRDWRNILRISSAKSWFFLTRRSSILQTEFSFVWTDTDLIFLLLTTQRDDIRYKSWRLKSSEMLHRVAW